MNMIPKYCPTYYCPVEDPTKLQNQNPNCNNIERELNGMFNMSAGYCPMCYKNTCAPSCTLSRNYCQSCPVERVEKCISTIESRATVVDATTNYSSDDCLSSVAGGTLDESSSYYGDHSDVQTFQNKKHGKSNRGKLYRSRSKSYRGRRYYEEFDDVCEKINGITEISRSGLARSSLSVRSLSFVSASLQKRRCPYCNSLKPECDDKSCNTDRRRKNFFFFRKK